MGQCCILARQVVYTLRTPQGNCFCSGGIHAICQPVGPTLRVSFWSLLLIFFAGFASEVQI